MMDTDKKRKTIRCQKCGLTFSGERVYCPLCKKRIIDEGTADSSIKEDFDVFPVTQKKQADFIFMKATVQRKLRFPFVYFSFWELKII